MSSPEQISPAHHYQTLIDLFNGAFFDSHQTVLVKGEAEPEYLPAAPDDLGHDYHRIIFAHGFFSSALHEIAHWCIAGKHRRTLVDFGYWYCPDGRDATQQKAFESMEVKPQAVEWCFSVAAGVPFQVSVDNLAGEAGDRFVFQQRVFEQVQAYLRDGLPVRAARFVSVLQSAFHTPPLNLTLFDWHQNGMKEC